MIKKLALTGVALSALLLSGCGGGGGSSDPMNDKNYIGIFNDTPAGVCESAEFSQILIELGLSNFITRETDASTTCATYGKTNNDVECTTDYIGGGTANCVIGFDNIPAGYNGLARQTGPVKLFDTMELMSQGF